MATTLANRAYATPRNTLADACAAPRRPAKAGLPERSADPIYDCIEAVQRKFDKSEKEMAALLDINPSNYTRRTYNAARVQRLPDDMRQLFIEYFAKQEGLTLNTPTPHEQVKAAAKLAIVNLLDLMESA